MSAALHAAPGSSVALLLAALRELELLQRCDPYWSGRLKLQLVRVRREWRAGLLADRDFATAVGDILAAGSVVRAEPADPLSRNGSPALRG